MTIRTKLADLPLEAVKNGADVSLFLAPAAEHAAIGEPDYETISTPFILIKGGDVWLSAGHRHQAHILQDSRPPDSALKHRPAVVASYAWSNAGDIVSVFSYLTEELRFYSTSVYHAADCLIGQPHTALWTETAPPDLDALKDFAARGGSGKVRVTFETGETVIAPLYLTEVWSTPKRVKFTSVIDALPLQLLDSALMRDVRSIIARCADVIKESGNKNLKPATPTFSGIKHRSTGFQIDSHGQHSFYMPDQGRFGRLPLSEATVFTRP